jgi:hypothetical protein
MKRIPDSLNRFLAVALLPFSVWQAGSLADKFTFTDIWIFLACYTLLILVFYAINRMGLFLLKNAFEHLMDGLEKDKQGNNNALS